MNWYTTPTLQAKHEQPKISLTMVTMIAPRILPQRARCDAYKLGKVVMVLREEQAVVSVCVRWQKKLI